MHVWEFASLSRWGMAIFEHNISQGSVATRLGYDRILYYHFVSNILSSLSLKEF